MAKTRLLVVDDDAIIRMVVSRCFARDPNVEVVASDCGRDALARLDGGEKFDAMLVDWMMPEISGYELIRKVRANPQFDCIRIMMLTAKTEMEDVKKALAAGASEYLMKPFTRELLLSKLDLLLLN